MYDLTVDGAHTFTVGDGLWVVHNCNFIDPNSVRFSQDSISYNFRGGGNIDQMADGLRSGEIDPSSVPPIRIVMADNGDFYTLDNRRLEAFRRAGISVPFQIISPAEAAREGWKFTTQTSGATIFVRGQPK